MNAQSLFEDAHDRLMTFLLRLHASAPDTPNRVVGELVAAEFEDDEEVNALCRHAFGVKAWGEIRPEALPDPTNRRSIRRVAGEEVVQQRVEWYDVTDEAEISQMIIECARQEQGHAMRRRDFEKVRRAMRAFPGVTAGEAARLAGVKLESLSYAAI